MNYKQLLTVGKSNDPSSSQLWFHLVNVAVLAVYLFIGIKVAYLVGADVSNAATLIDSVVWFTLVISGIITGNKFANVFLHLKQGKNDAPATLIPKE